MRLPALIWGLVLAVDVRAQGDAALIGTVTSVIDGDTIKVQLTDRPVTVRLAHIDAPESYQPGGVAATRALHDRVLAREVSLRVTARDGEETALAVVHLGDENLNAWMVKQAYAWAYRGSTRDADYCA